MSSSQNIKITALFGYKLKKTQHLLRLCMDEGLKALNLTTPQYAVLAQLEIQPGISNADLARAAFITPQTMHGIVANLEKRNLVERKKTPNHGRILSTKLTEQGYQTVQKAHIMIQNIEKKMFKTINKENQKKLEQLLIESFNNLKNCIKINS